MSELRACPFCGCKQIDYDENYGIYCDDCGYGWSFEGMEESNEECVRIVSEKWNTRPIEDELRARIAELESQQRWIPVSEPPEMDEFIIGGSSIDGWVNGDMRYKDGKFLIYSYTTCHWEEEPTCTHYKIRPTPPIE